MDHVVRKPIRTSSITCAASGSRRLARTSTICSSTPRARFEGAGCAISTVSASLMTEVLKGKSEAQAHSLVEQFRALVTGAPSPATHADATLPRKFRLLESVREFPTRVKCATLCWHTLRAALANEHRPVSTE